MTIVFLLAAVQAFFLLSLLIAKASKSAADKVLMFWLAGIGVHTLVYFLHFHLQLSVPIVLNLNAGIPLLRGPFLLAYIAALVGLRERIEPVDYLHLLPFAGYMVFVATSLRGFGLQAFIQPENIVSVDIFSLSMLLTVALVISIPAYIVWSLAIVRRANMALDSANMSPGLVWTRLFIVGLGVVWLFSVVSYVLSRNQEAPTHLVFWALTLFVYAMGYLGLTRTSVFSQPEMEVLKQTLRPKYQKSGLSSDDTETIYRQIVSRVEQEQLYLDGDLSLQDLAAVLKLSANHASQAINEFEQQNFRDFLNSRRIDEACRRLRIQPDTNLLALALDVGFNSKSSFNRAFRKFAGTSASEFIAGD